MFWKAASRLRMAVPWETTATVWPGWFRTSCRTEAVVRLRSSRKDSPPSARNSGALRLKRSSSAGSSRATSPQVRSSQSPRWISRSPFRVVRARPLGLQMAPAVVRVRNRSLE